MPFDPSKYEEVKVLTIPDPDQAGSGVEIVIYYYNDPSHQKTPRCSIRGYFHDKNSNQTIRTKGAQTNPKNLRMLEAAMKGLADTYEGKYGVQMIVPPPPPTATVTQ